MMKRIGLGCLFLITLQVFGSLVLFEYVWREFSKDVHLAARVWYGWTVLQIILVSAWGVQVVRLLLSWHRKTEQKASDYACHEDLPDAAHEKPRSDDSVRG
ncbi:MAG: hypothetical protein AAFX05_08145 [Planctomycetota bacterium]